MQEERFSLGENSNHMVTVTPSNANLKVHIRQEAVREKCTGCQTNEPSPIGHELCLMPSSEEQVNLCFGEVYKRVISDEVLDNCYYKKVIEMPVNLNPETLAILRETVNPKDFMYKNRIRKWLIESQTLNKRGPILSLLLLS